MDENVSTNERKLRVSPLDITETTDIKKMMCLKTLSCKSYKHTPYNTRFSVDEITQVPINQVQHLSPIHKPICSLGHYSLIKKPYTIEDVQKLKTRILFTKNRRKKL